MCVDEDDSGLGVDSTAESIRMQRSFLPQSRYKIICLCFLSLDESDMTVQSVCFLQRKRSEMVGSTRDRGVTRRFRINSLACKGISRLGNWFLRLSVEEAHPDGDFTNLTRPRR